MFTTRTFICVAVRKRGGGEGDSLDEYMSVVSSQLDPATITQLRKQLAQLEKARVYTVYIIHVCIPVYMYIVHVRIRSSMYNVHVYTYMCMYSHMHMYCTCGHVYTLYMYM